MQREAEDLAKSLWNIINSVSGSLKLPDLKAKREQLKVINESIQQLSQRNVPVPEEFQKLNETLTSEVEQSDKDHVVLFFLREQLSQMLAKIESHVGIKNSGRENRPLKER